MSSMSCLISCVARVCKHKHTNPIIQKGKFWKRTNENIRFRRQKVLPPSTSKCTNAEILPISLVFDGAFIRWIADYTDVQFATQFIRLREYDVWLIIGFLAGPAREDGVIVNLEAIRLVGPDFDSPWRRFISWDTTRVFVNDGSCRNDTAWVSSTHISTNVD